ncbi:MAG: lysine--tRNA ligase [bacterium]
MDIKQSEEQDRLKKLEYLYKQGINPYPAQSNKKQSCEQAKASKEGAQVCVAGRIMSKRIMGKLSFCHLQDQSGRVQVAISDKELGKDDYKLFIKFFDMGDFVELTGNMFITHKGENTVLVKKYRLLSKALRPLPEKFHGLQDQEEQFRKRYLDILLDPELKELFFKKTRFWNSMREFLVKQGFLEVETPILETTAGGADANPFVTHHDALDMDVYLRISMGELWQKRLMVAGLEKTFEIGRQFRNEGLSREHLQDYTQMEFYWAYADYTKGMKLVEDMYKYVIKQSFGSLKFDIDKYKDIDLEQKWGKISYAEEIKKQTGINILKANDQEMLDKIKELHIEAKNLSSRGRIMDTLWKYCRKNIKGPVFLMDHPVDVSPLAKRKQDDPKLTERYQIIIAGSELGNGYSELNDPVDQAQRFNEQAKMREQGDSEAQMHDSDFVEALEHGMPPTTGFGLSERLFSFLANRPIRECVLFPLMKPDEK